jgi:hypothetical protein
MPLVQRDDTVVEKNLELHFWMKDEKTGAHVPVRIDRAAIGDFNSAVGYSGARLASFKVSRGFFCALASALYDRDGGSEKSPVIISTADLSAFPEIAKWFDPIGS